jgi:hypothetical protein
MMVKSSARMDLGIQDVGIVLFIRWRSGPSGTGRRLGRLDSAGAPPGWGVEDLTVEFYCQTIAPFANPPNKVAVAMQGPPQEQEMPSFERAEA